MAHTCSGDTQADTIQPQTTVHSLPDRRHQSKVLFCIHVTFTKTLFCIIPCASQLSVTFLDNLEIHLYTCIHIHVCTYQALRCCWGVSSQILLYHLCRSPAPQLMKAHGRMTGYMHSCCCDGFFSPVPPHQLSEGPQALRECRMLRWHLAVSHTSGVTLSVSCQGGACSFYAEMG